MIAGSRPNPQAFGLPQHCENVVSELLLRSHTYSVGASLWLRLVVATRLSATLPLPFWAKMFSSKHLDSIYGHFSHFEIQHLGFSKLKTEDVVFTTFVLEHFVTFFPGSCAAGHARVPTHGESSWYEQGGACRVRSARRIGVQLEQYSE